MFSIESMALMHGAVSTPGQGQAGNVSGLVDAPEFLVRTCRCLGTGTDSTDLSTRVILPSAIDEATNIEYFGPQGEKVESGEFVEGEWYIAQWKIESGENAKTIEISANSFPGTYRIVGLTYARDQTTGTDKFFELEIPQAKMAATQTITMQAEGKLKGLLSLNPVNCWELLKIA